jgi:phage gpG-like protein
MAVGVRIRIELNGVDRRLRNLADGTQDYKEPLRKSGTYMERSIGMRFRKAQWKPLSPATIKIHPHRAGGKPLNDTGKLKMSVTSRAVKRVTSHRLQYGTNLVYAPLHNFGGRGGWGKYIPKREFLYFDHKDERAIKRIFEDYIKELSENG